MEVDKCIFCKRDLEYQDYGGFTRYDYACENLSICNHCIRLLKREMEKSQ